MGSGWGVAKIGGSCLARKGTRSFLMILLLISQWRELGHIAAPPLRRLGNVVLLLGKHSPSKQSITNNQLQMGKWENKYWEKVYNHAFLFHCNGTVVPAGRVLWPTAWHREVVAKQLAVESLGFNLGSSQIQRGACIRTFLFKLLWLMKYWI